MIAARVIDPCSKLATARGLEAQTASSSLADTLQLSSATEDDLYAAMDWLLARQPRLEKRLAEREAAMTVAEFAAHKEKLRERVRVCRDRKRNKARGE